MKKGVTLISIIIYLVLFTTFSVFAVSMNSNIRTNILMDKGKNIIETEYGKIYTNLLMSSKESVTYNCSINSGVGTIYFSNGDTYEVNVADGKIMKNGGVLTDNLINIKKVSSQEVQGTIVNNTLQVESVRCLILNIELKKYNAIINRDIVITLGDE